MPIAAAIPAIAGIGSSILGGVAGASNRRPPSLDSRQQWTLDNLLKDLYPMTKGPAKIDPIQRALMFGNIAQEATGAANRTTNMFASRGLGNSGLHAQGLMNVSNAQQAAQNQTDLTLQQRAVEQRNETIRQIMGLLGIQNVPGQSGFGGFMAGFAPPMAYFLSKLGGGGGFTTSGQTFPH